MLDPAPSTQPSWRICQSRSWRWANQVSWDTTFVAFLREISRGEVGRCRKKKQGKSVSQEKSNFCTFLSDEILGVIKKLVIQDTPASRFFGWNLKRSKHMEHISEVGFFFNFPGALVNVSARKLPLNRLLAKRTYRFKAWTSHIRIQIVQISRSKFSLDLNSCFSWTSNALEKSYSLRDTDVPRKHDFIPESLTDWKLDGRSSFLLVDLEVLFFLFNFLPCLLKKPHTLGGIFFQKNHTLWEDPLRP